MEDKGVTISIINNNPGLVIKAQTEEEYLKFRSWAVPAFKSIREAYAKYVTPTTSTPKGEVCPKCGKMLQYKETPNGKKMMKCSGGKWNPITKRTDGCDYVRWINDDEDKMPSDQDRGDDVRNEPNF